MFHSWGTAAEKVFSLHLYHPEEKLIADLALDHIGLLRVSQANKALA